MNAVDRFEVQTNEKDAVVLEWDWDFDKVPDGELVACCYWEYARESAFIRDVRQRCWKDEQPEGKRDERLHTDLQKVQSIGYHAHCFLHGFFCPPEWRALRRYVAAPSRVRFIA